MQIFPTLPTMFSFASFFSFTFCLIFPSSTLCFQFARIFHQSAKPAYFCACRAQIMHAKSTKTLRAELATPPAYMCHKPLTALTFTFDSSPPSSSASFPSHQSALKEAFFLLTFHSTFTLVFPQQQLEFCSLSFLFFQLISCVN